MCGAEKNFVIYKILNHNPLYCTITCRAYISICNGIFDIGYEL